MRSASARTSTSLLCGPADAPAPFFCAYIRWSAIRSASTASSASSGRKIEPYEQPIEKPSPCSESACGRPVHDRLDDLLARLEDAQNSSPPIR